MDSNTRHEIAYKLTNIKYDVNKAYEQIEPKYHKILDRIFEPISQLLYDVKADKYK